METVTKILDTVLSEKNIGKTFLFAGLVLGASSYVGLKYDVKPIPPIVQEYQNKQTELMTLDSILCNPVYYNISGSNTKLYSVEFGNSAVYTKESDLLARIDFAKAEIAAIQNNPELQNASRLEAKNEDNRNFYYSKLGFSILLMIIGGFEYINYRIKRHYEKKDNKARVPIIA